MNNDLPATGYICPICATALTFSPTGKSYQCANRHSFDLAREGYVNLLPVQHKHSTEPGDNKAMLTARRAFLEAGYYQPLAQAIALLICAYSAPQILRLLDVGCGEGYYLRQLSQHCPPEQTIERHGVDIAKAAIAAAAKKDAAARYCVASAQRLPYTDQYFDVLMRVFAPSNAAELQRVLKPAGHFLLVTPGPRHLSQLKDFIYAEVKEHAEAAELPDGFELLTSQRISRWITPNRDERAALLQMTPFAWRANPESQQALAEPETLAIETDFILTLARKQC
ncbi:MAG: 23S rRNA (guanine(745)-N(1))-methyltransferase [Methylovulum sp.]|uniref:23S rRNA (guanine(745)-N(1))-methyltransferase n=1 Tax=Methylovulum sp. TaxID=1916980 RepID=UPI00261D1660|nr:23S rRNA (guanine(745)-N(1))-methyltransferase [Methylovulum sp.]MDD2724276.1 23S rRNA (guanine(745)-N(1))-methyltransferase [Methylovulum sp.]MDD5122991.1 23S rRNA (guanine(745)-N(1))-methyltransferase [Methylovulum sp.]